MTTITCDHCESEIDIATDKNCVVYDPSGITAVICKSCREGEFARWVEYSRIKRGWRA